MTRVEHLSIRLSANDLLKHQYGVALRWSVLVAILLLSLLWMLMPRYEPAPYTLRQDYLEIIDIQEDKIVLPEEKLIPPPPMPRVIEVVDDKDPRAVEIEPPIWPIDPTPRLMPLPGPPEVRVPTSSTPRLLFQAKPNYPQVARMSGLEGTVIVAVQVGRDGRVRAVRLERGVHPLLNKAALAAAMKCRFEPGTQRSIPVRAWMSVPYRFRLH